MIVNLHNANTDISDVDEECIQPNAVDLRLEKVFKINNNTFTIDSNNNKQHRGSEELKPDSDGFWTLQPGCYEVIMKSTVKVGHDECGILVPRSTLNRNGCFITSGLYDSGYNGVVGGCLHVEAGSLVIEKGTRVAQYVCFKAESVKLYDGSYGLGKDNY
jgi:deoxycytidine triphosphate deaminase